MSGAERSNKRSVRQVKRDLPLSVVLGFGEEVTHMLEWLAAAVDFIAGLFRAETVSWG